MWNYLSNVKNKKNEKLMKSEIPNKNHYFW